MTFSQNYTMVLNTSSNTGDTITWSITNVNTGAVLHNSTHSSPHVMTIHFLEFPDGVYQFEIENSNCESFNGGSYAFTSSDDVISYTNSSFCQNTSLFTVSTQEDCFDSCPFDHDNNGVVGVTDLILFIFAFGTICN